jgi:hypothetical protein
MLVKDTSLAQFVIPQLFSFLNDLEAAVAEHYEGDPLRIVAEYVTEEDMTSADQHEILAALNLSYEAALIIRDSADGNESNPHYSHELYIRIKDIVDKL